MTARTSRRLSRRPRATKPQHARLRLEALEDRSLLDASGVLNQLLVTTHHGAVQTVKLEDGQGLSDAIAAYQASGAFATVEADQTVSVAVLPTDSRFGELFGLHNTGQSGGTLDADIDAPEAWDLTTGSTRVVVGIIDTGIDYRHQDLFRNIWLNQGEIPSAVRALLVDTDGDGLITFRDLNDARNQGPGKITDLNGNGRIDGGDVLAAWSDGTDADGNGYRDDLVGWDFVNNDNDPFDDNGHGTHVAGTIGATANDGGVVGVNWNVQMVGLKFLGANGSGSTSGAVAALNYAVAMGVKITNNSWGGGGYSSAMFTALSNARAQGHIFVAAAGNAGSNNDSVATYPANYALDNVISVAATDRNDRLASFSNYGATQVDLAAPGVSILSTTPNGTYSSYSGTSMAAPHVAGAVALLMAKEPGLSYSQAISRILTNVDPVAALSGKVATGGRLNVFRALSASSAPPADQSGPRVVSAVASGTASVSSVRLTFSEAIDAASFTAADITGFTGPNGALAVSGIDVVAGSNDTQFDVRFATQTAGGSYSFTVGPDVRDKAGNRMDQNNNGVAGEASGDSYRAQFTVTPRVVFANNTPVALPDLRTTISTIVVGQDVTIADLNVTLNITHTYDGDLEVRLVHADGTSVTLVNRRGGSGDNFTNTVFDDEAATAISRGKAPFSGSFRPEQALSAFDGKNARGTWQLVITDRASRDTGTLRSWSLSVEGAAGAAGRRSVEAVGESAPAVSPPAAAPSPAPSLDTAVGRLGSLLTSLSTPLAAPAATSTAGLRQETPTSRDQSQHGTATADVARADRTLALDELFAALTAADRQDGGSEGEGAGQEAEDFAF